MTTQTPALEVAPADILTADEYAKAVREAESFTVESINAIVVNPPALQSAQLVAKHTFARFVGILRTIKTAYAEAPIDLTTTAGEKAAREIRQKFVTLRTKANKVRLEQNRVFIEQQKANNDEYAMLEDAVLPIEKRYDDAIQEKERADAEKKRLREVEIQQRAEAITRFILSISAFADNLVGMSSADIAARIQEVTLLELSEEALDHRYGEAVTIKDRTIARLEAARAEKEQSEANAAQVEQDRKRFAAEREARTGIDKLNELMASAGALNIPQLEAAIQQVEATQPATFAPLESEAQSVIGRVLPALRQMYREKTDAEIERVAQADRAARAAKEAKARERIAAMKSLVADCIGASSASIRSTIASVNALLMADFEPFTKEAEEEQGRVLTSLEKLRIAAEAEERTAAEKQAEADRIAAEARAATARKQAIDNAIAHVEGTARRAELSAMTSKELRGEIDYLSNAENFTESLFGDRLQEAKDIAGDEIEALEELFAKVKKAEDDAEKEAAERAARAEQEALELAAKTRRAQVLTSKAEALYELLEAVRADANYVALDKNLRADIDGLTGEIVAAF